MDHIEQRILKLEFRMDDHQQELQKLQDISETLKNSLAAIEKTLSQIKYLAMGAAVVVVGQAVGFDKVIKLFFS